MRRLVCILVVVAGCGPSSYNEFRDQLTTRWCERQIRCGDVAGSDSQHCGVPGPLVLIMGGAVDVPTAMAAHRMTFHPDNAHECLDAVKSAPCDKEQAADDLYRHCHGVVTGAVENGQACLGDEECLGGACAGVACGSGVCTPYAAHGAPCVATGGTPAETCDPSVMFCNVGRGVCEHKIEKGRPCTDDAQCLFDGACVDGKCADPARTGRDDVCGSTLPPCEDGLFCGETGACEPLADAGAACARPDACKPGMTCIGGVCAPWLDVGGACSAAPGNIASGCASSAPCSASACTPAPSQPLGPLARCSADADCATGLHCAAGGYCFYKSGVGAVCQADHECIDGAVCRTTCTLPAPPVCAPPG